MLQIKGISKKYTTGELVQEALNDVSFNLRDNEFVAVLGPSGSGITTLLNVIGGLDRYDIGDMIINGISTKQYKDRDWDSYRNHSIGFVFQSYNLIPHQSILANVELALTISGISRGERRKRAQKALDEVGLGDQLHKRPNQMSGGQMQRVAIARALVNDPSILLADEPTGALDSETSLQVMALLKEVANDRLVIMVTHNAELADQYANRVIRLLDGKIVSDTNPFSYISTKDATPEHKNMGKASMSFFTALSLSFNNLRTTMGRTLLTAFAGSIGIIGIALIISLSTGVNDYIADIQKETMTSYPITINAQSIDLSSMMEDNTQGFRRENSGHEMNGVYSNAMRLEMASKMVTSITENNLTAFKEYLDDPNAEIQKYLGENGILYSYEVPFSAYATDPNGKLINTDGSTFSGNGSSSSMAFSGEGQVPSGMQSMMRNMRSIMPAGMSLSSNPFEQLIPGNDGSLVSAVVTDSYDLVHGEWPAKEDEVILVLNSHNEIPLTTLYTLGLLPSDEYQTLMNAVEEDEDFKAEVYHWSFEDISAQKFYLVPASDYYISNDNGTFTSLVNDPTAVAELAENGIELKISGLIRPKEDAANATFGGTVGYTKALTDRIIAHANESPVVQAQLASPDVNVLSGMTFAPADDAAKIENAKKFIDGLGISGKAALLKEMASSMGTAGGQGVQAFLAMDEVQLASMLDQYLANYGDEMLLMIYNSRVSSGSYNENLEAFGYVSLDAPASISIYADSFEDKDAISACIDEYNRTADEGNRIVYTDFVKLLMSSVTTIINVISYVLIAFVAVSLVVSSIMIGIITYISVLERTKEIGILRAIGASKRNISQVFNAETFIVGLCAGLIGIGVSMLLLIPGNAVIHALTGSVTVNAVLPMTSAGILVLLSVILTLIGGLIPSRKAAKKDPVAALRTE